MFFASHMDVSQADRPLWATRWTFACSGLVARSVDEEGQGRVSNPGVYSNGVQIPIASIEKMHLVMHLMQDARGVAKNAQGTGGVVAGASPPAWAWAWA